MAELQVNGERLWQSLMTMAEIGATPNGGVNRQTLTDEDRRGRDLFRRWCEEAGLSVSVDRMGTMFARREGADEGRPPVLLGSHLDSQPTGGKFDGALGVLGALEVIRTLNDHGIETQAPLEVVNWTNEEGCRFPPAMIASGVFAGVFELDYGLSRKDHAGRTIGQELQRIGYAGERPVGGRPIGALFELHIEQGPILEAEGQRIGIVTGGQGARWYDCEVLGAETHAGPAPMEVRRDALRAAAAMLEDIYQIAHAHAPDGRATVGEFQAYPGSRNTVPGRVAFTVDLRHPDGGTMDAMDHALREVFEQARGRHARADRLPARRDLVLAAGRVRSGLHRRGAPGDHRARPVRARDRQRRRPRRGLHGARGAHGHDLRAVQGRHQPCRGRVRLTRSLRRRRQRAPARGARARRRVTFVQSPGAARLPAVACATRLVASDERHLGEDEQDRQAGEAEHLEGHPDIGRLGAPDDLVEGRHRDEEQRVAQRELTPGGLAHRRHHLARARASGAVGRMPARRAGSPRTAPARWSASS